MVPIVEPRLDAVPSVGDTNWYTAADPSSIDTIEYCYLEGAQGVNIETRQGFEVDGVEIKARLDFRRRGHRLPRPCRRTPRRRAVTQHFDPTERRTRS